jgi:hypothetical protein
MTVRRVLTRAARWCAAGAGAGAGCYATYVGVTWLRYGRPRPPSVPEENDALLDRFMPAYEVVERHRTHVAAPAEITLAAACNVDLGASSIVHALFRGRELLPGSTPDDRQRPSGMLASLKSMGWGVLAATPGREIVMGAATRPWHADIEFRAIPPEEFATFHDPGYVKIAVTLRADPLSDHESVFRTETRAIATDANARRRFRRYWAFLSPGIILIRLATLGAVRGAAERRARGLRAAACATAVI